MSLLSFIERCERGEIRHCNRHDDGGVEWRDEWDQPYRQAITADPGEQCGCGMRTAWHPAGYECPRNTP